MTETPLVRAAVLTVSDTGSRGEHEDRSGDVAVERLRGLPAAVAWRRQVPDDRALIRAAVVDACAEAGLLVVTGGTGLGSRDVTPQTVGPLLDFEVPGMAEAMRSRGLLSTPHAMLSRQVVGVREGCLVLTLPGSPLAVVDCLDAVWQALPHALSQLAGGSGGHAASPGSGADVNTAAGAPAG